MNVTRAFVPHFRPNGAGTFLNVSSIGGLITFPMMSLYHSSKWAVEGFSESLSHELRDLGFVVKIVEPVGVDTDFGGRSMTYAAKEGLTAYDETIAIFRSNIANLGIQRSSAEAIAEGIFHAATDGKRQLRYVVGPDAEQLYASRRELDPVGVRRQDVWSSLRRRRRNFPENGEPPSCVTLYLWRQVRIEGITQPESLCCSIVYRPRLRLQLGSGKFPVVYLPY